MRNLDLDAKFLNTTAEAECFQQPHPKLGLHPTFGDWSDYLLDLPLDEALLERMKLHETECLVCQCRIEMILEIQQEADELDEAPSPPILTCTEQLHMAVLEDLSHQVPVEPKLRAIGVTGLDYGKHMTAPMNPRQVPGAKSSKLTVVDPARVGEVFGSLINVEIVPTVGYAEFGMAASHEAPKPMSSQRRFNIAWKQGEHEWSMEGLSVGDGHELVLSSKDGLQPGSITWKNSATGETELLALRTSNDGRILICGIPLSKALKRAKTIQGTVDETKRREMLPVVHMVGEAP